MLTELRIKDFAIIEDLSLNFETGLAVFTGETGAGKSIIFDAVEVLLGGRADTTQVRSGSEQAILEGTFQLMAEARAPVQAILAREELLDDEEYVTIGREIRAAGRSVARLNGRTVNVSLLKEIGELLVDLHGQSEHLSLLRTREHLGLLDRFAGNQAALEAYQATYQRLQVLRKQLKELRQAEQNTAQHLDLLNYQINEIESAQLSPDEEEDLRAERTRLANAESLAELTQEALQALDEGLGETPAASDLLGQVVHALARLKRLDPSQSELYDQAEAVFETLSDLGRALRGYLEEIEFNPRRLDFVEERLNLIHNLKRKYGSSLTEVLAFADKARLEREEITYSEARIEELEGEEARLLTQLAEQGQGLSATRREAAEQLSTAVQQELADLRMEGAQFQVAFTRQPDPQGLPVGEARLAFNKRGFEEIEFLIAPNPGEGFKPLVRIASGGETSRLMLALKNVLAQADSIPTLIFDEIDQGIGGRVGVIVGQKLWNLSRQHQVLCITHLPQLAAYGDTHIHVAKLLDGGRTITQVTRLTGEPRIVELAQMFGEVSEGTLKSAREIFQTAQKTAVS